MPDLFDLAENPQAPSDGNEFVSDADFFDQAADILENTDAANANISTVYNQINSLYNSQPWGSSVEEALPDIGTNVKFLFNDFETAPAFQAQVDPLPVRGEDQDIEEYRDDLNVWAESQKARQKLVGGAQYLLQANDLNKILDEQVKQSFRAEQARDKFGDNLEDPGILNRASDLVARVGEGLVADTISGFGGLAQLAGFEGAAQSLQDAATSVEDAFVENPETDDEFVSKFARAAGLLGGQALTFLATSGAGNLASAAGAGAKVAGLGRAFATTTALAPSAGLEVGQVYEEVLSRTADKDKALEASLAAVPIGVLDSALDYFKIGKILPSKYFGKLTKNQKIKGIKEAIDNETTRKGLVDIGQDIASLQAGRSVSSAFGNALKNIAGVAALEGTAEAIQGAASDALVREVTGDTTINPLDIEARGEEFLLGAALGGAAGGIGSVVQSRGDNQVLNNLSSRVQERQAEVDTQKQQEVNQNLKEVNRDVRQAPLSQEEVVSSQPQEQASQLQTPEASQTQEASQSLEQTNQGASSQVVEGNGLQSRDSGVQIPPGPQQQTTVQETNLELESTQTPRQAIQEAEAIVIPPGPPSDARAIEVTNLAQPEPKPVVARSEAPVGFAKTESRVDQAENVLNVNYTKPVKVKENNNKVVVPTGTRETLLENQPKDQVQVYPKDRVGKTLNSMGGSNINEWRERNFSRRVTENETIEPGIRDIVGQDFYIPITNKDTLEQVKEKVQGKNLIQAANHVRDGASDLSFVQRVALGEVVITELNKAAKAANVAGDIENARLIEEEAADTTFAIAEFGTELGRGVQAFTMFNKLNPQAAVMMVEKQRQKTAEKEGKEFNPLDEKARKEITELLEKAKAAPEGFIKNDIQREAFARMAREDDVSSGEVLTSLWKASLLSGPNTQAINLFGNGIHQFLRALGVSVVNNPRDSINMFRGMLKSATGEAIVEAQSALRGRDITKTLEKLDVKTGKQRVSELRKLIDKTEKSTFERALTPFAVGGDFVFRMLSGGDAYFYRTAKDGRAHLAVSKSLRKDPEFQKNNISLAQAVAQDLYGTPEQAVAARQQAEIDVQALSNPTQNDIDRRTFEILEQQNKDQELLEDIERFGTLNTFTNTPFGFMGVLAKAVNNTIDAIRIPDVINIPIGQNLTQVRVPVVGGLSPLSFAVPFVNIVANVTSAGLDFTPVGIARAVAGGSIFSKKDRTFTPQERLDRIGTAIVGMAATGVLMSTAEQFLEDDDPAFAVYGMGPNDKGQRRNLQNQGWQPFSIKIGETYLKYNETPLAIPFSTIGGLHDAIRFSDSFNRKDALDRLAYAGQLSTRAVVESGFLKGVRDILDILDNKKPVSAFAANVGSGFIPAQGLLRDINRIVNPEIFDTKQSGFLGNVFKNTPFAQATGAKPALNVFGDPVEYDVFRRTPVLSRFASVRTEDPNWRFIADRGLTIPAFNDTTKVGVSGLTKAGRRKVEKLKNFREKEIGRGFAGVFTPEEHYRYIEITGPKIKSAIETIRKNRSNLKKPELQKLIDKEVRKAKREGKLEIIREMVKGAN